MTTTAPGGGRTPRTPSALPEPRAAGRSGAHPAPPTVPDGPGTAGPPPTAPLTAEAARRMGRTPGSWFHPDEGRATMGAAAAAPIVALPSSGWNRLPGVLPIRRAASAASGAVGGGPAVPGPSGTVGGAGCAPERPAAPGSGRAEGVRGVRPPPGAVVVIAHSSCVAWLVAVASMGMGAYGAWALGGWRFPYPGLPTLTRQGTHVAGHSLRRERRRRGCGRYSGGKSACPPQGHLSYP